MKKGDFGKWLKRTQKDYGYTYKELSSRSGMSETALKNIASGGDLKLSSADEITKAFGQELHRVIKNIESTDKG